MGLFDHNEEPVGLQFDETIQSYYYNSARWGKFLAIIGFIFTGIIVLAGLFMMIGGVSTGNLGLSIAGPAFGLLYLLLAVVYFIPAYFLYKFSVKAMFALKHNDHENFTLSFKNLNSMFQFMGILTIIMISLYVLGIIFAIIMGVVGAS